MNKTIDSILCIWISIIKWGMQVHRRVKLAIKLDELLRTERKQKAEKSWAHANAEALGIDLSDSEIPPGDEEEERGRSSKVSTQSCKTESLSGLFLDSQRL